MCKLINRPVLWVYNNTSIIKINVGGVIISTECASNRETR